MITAHVSFRPASDSFSSASDSFSSASVTISYCQLILFFLAYKFIAFLNKKKSFGKTRELKCHFWHGAETFVFELWYYRKRGSASYIVREVLSVRERDTDRERERRKWRHHCRAKIGDEFTLSLAKNSHNWRWAYTFPCQKFALFVSPFTLPVSPFAERSPWWRWNAQRVHTFHCQKIFRTLCSSSFKWLEPRDEWSKTQDKWSNLPSPIFLPIEKMNQINTKNYWK